MDVLLPRSWRSCVDARLRLPAVQLVGVAGAFFLVDSVGRRPLLLWGSLGCAASLAALVAADWGDSHWGLVAGMSAFMLCFSVSWAGVFWVLLSEIFSMGAKSPAAAAATATLFLTGALADLIFLAVHAALGPGAFGVYALIAAAAAAYVAAAVPETKGKTLLEVQALLAVPDPSSERQWLDGDEEAAGGGGGGGGGEERRGLVPAGRERSVELPEVPGWQR
jgi:MFS family permease